MGYVKHNGNGDGATIATNGLFDGNADGWTLGLDWAYDDNDVVHTPGLAQEMFQTAAIEDTTYYFFSLYVGGTVGSVQVSVGSAVFSAAIPAGSGVVKVLCLSTGGDQLHILPTSDFDGNIKQVIVTTAFIEPLQQDFLAALPAGNYKVSLKIGGMNGSVQVNIAD